MKKSFLIGLVIIAFLSSCENSGNKPQEAQNRNAINSESTVKEKVFIKTISYKDFVKNIWDFETNPNEFVFKGSKPCVIDFYATWCGPCKTIAPIIEKLAEEYDGKIDFYKVDCDKEMKLASIMQVENIPLVFFMKNDTQPEKSVGAKDEAFFRSQINKLLSE